MKFYNSIADVILLVVILNYPVVGQFGPTPAPTHRPQQDDVNDFHDIHYKLYILIIFIHPDLCN